MYAFDHHLDAKAVSKEKFVWMLYMGIFFFLLYGSSNQYAGLTSPHPSFWMAWEQQIPFIEAFIVPYMSSDVMFVIAFFMPYARLELRILAARILFIILLSCMVFVLFPLQFSFEKPEIQSFTLLFGILEADLPFNQLPSLHVAFTIVLWASMKKYLKNRLLKAFVALWFLLIVFSTVLVYQHHFIDIPTGAIAGLLAVFLIKEEKQSVLTHGFSTPRSLKMALYYIAGAVLFMLLAFYMASWCSWFFLWVFATLLLVSIIYAFGLNTLLAGKNAKASWWQWIFFAPYFVGNYLSWQYYKRKLPLMQEVKESVYLGRYPSTQEYKLLEEEGIELSLNLATEQQIQRNGLSQIRLPFLDQTIQSPESLHQGVLHIEEHKNNGIYVHCTLGLSRSVLLVSAWLIYQGCDIEDAQKEIAKVRPRYVKSPYMDITLKMYKEYLANKNRNIEEEVE
ncbi:MAG: hypothetical protein HF962_00300 [Sulfurovum sp.]|nr:hypothetical protein [Sulfurovum sp.]